MPTAIPKNEFRDTKVARIVAACRYICSAWRAANVAHAVGDSHGGRPLTTAFDGYRAHFVFDEVSPARTNTGGLGDSAQLSLPFGLRPYAR
jgi:hypothetical protein